MEKAYNRNEHVREIAESLSKVLDLKAKNIGDIFKHWARKSPPDYTMDAMQDCAVAVLDASPNSYGLIHAICRARVRGIWEAWHKRQHYSLDAPINLDDATDSPDAQKTLGDMVLGVVEFEHHVIGEISEKALWLRIPPLFHPWIRDILMGQYVNPTKHKQIREWASQNRHVLTTVA